MKTIVTHIGPDVDAICAIWLVKTFFPGWEEASLAFVPAGKTLKDLAPDEDPEIIHVDTGFGKFDHHQSDADTCAARLVYEEIASQNGEDAALDRLTKVVNEIDHFREVFFPDPTNDVWDISLPATIDGWRLLYSDDPLKIVALGMDVLDGIYKTFQNKVWAEKELREKGVEFSTKWGKALGVETTNDETVHLAQKMGYAVVVRKDPKKGYLRIKSLPKKEIDLTSLYEQLKSEEPEATWFLHASRHMVLNGSTKNPDFRPSQKSLAAVIDLLKKMQ
ncbi:chromate resistance protein [Candidatus Gottesmanbacteria bacterium]|nr:chromate resistance protein [Candidatus Gottesmanbacteria bacterium]